MKGDKPLNNRCITEDKGRIGGNRRQEITNSLEIPAFNSVLWGSLDYVVVHAVKGYREEIAYSANMTMCRSFMRCGLMQSSEKLRLLPKCVAPSLHKPCRKAMFLYQRPLLSLTCA